MLAIQQRVDRELLICCYEGSKNVLHAPMRLFGEVPGNGKDRIDPEHPTVIAATAFMKPILDEFAAGCLKRGDLLKARDERLLQQALPSASKKPVKKRPAASAPPSTSAPSSSSTAVVSVPTPTSAESAQALLSCPPLDSLADLCHSAFL